MQRGGDDRHDHAPLHSGIIKYTNIMSYLSSEKFVRYIINLDLIA